MANYAVTDHVTDTGTPTEVAADIETYLETIDSTKVIRLLEVVKWGGGYKGIIIHDA